MSRLRQTHQPASRPMRLALQGAVAALAILLAVRTGLFSATLPAIADEPVGAVEFMAAHGFHGNVLCGYRWGVYVIWHQAPFSRVFIDSFEIMYPAVSGRLSHVQRRRARGRAGARRVSQ